MAETVEVEEVVKDGLSEIVERHIPKIYETEVCFFAESGSFIRMRGNGDGIDLILRQVTYRCGSCGQPVSEQQMDAHFDHHARQFSEAVNSEKKKRAK